MSAACRSCIPRIDSRGAVITSTDSAILQFDRNTYNYMWPRDGALVARALDRAGYNDVTRAIYQFCATTCAAVYGALMAATHFAEAFGELERAMRYRGAAGAIKVAMETYLFSCQRGRFVRMLIDDPYGRRHEDPTIDASLYGLFAFGAFEATDPRVVATMEAVRARLWVQTDVRRLGCYENDWYWQVSQDIARVPGNPLIICTL